MIFLNNSLNLKLANKFYIYELPKGFDIAKNFKIYDINISQSGFNLLDPSIPFKYINISSMRIFDLTELQASNVKILSSGTLLFDKELLTNEVRKSLIEFGLNEKDIEYKEMLSKVSFLEDQIKKYEDNKTKKDELRKLQEQSIIKIKVLKESLANVEKFQAKIEQSLKRKKYLESLYSSMRSDYGTYVDKLKSDRIKLFHTKMRNVRNFNNQNSYHNISELDYIVGEGLLVLSLTQFFVLLLIILNLGFSQAQLLFSLVFIIFNIFSFLVFNKFRFREKFEHTIHKEEKSRFSFENIVGRLERKQLEDIKHNAIINALQKDYSFWLESIKKLSGGMDIQHLRKEINDLETSMQTNYIATDVWIDSQEKFYEWKRELNICKIEVESLALPNIENQNKYYEYQKAFNFLAKISFINPQITLPLFVKVGEIFNHEIDFNDLDNLNIDQNIFLLKFVD